MSKQKTYVRGNWKLAGCFSLFLQVSGNEFCSGDVAEFCQSKGIPPRVVTKNIGNLFRGFCATNVIERTNKYRLNQYSVPTIVWRTK